MTKEQLIAAAWEKGALKFLLRKHQYPIYDAMWACIGDQDPKHNSHVINCARQFGKSFTEQVVMVEFAIRHPGATLLFVAPLKSQAYEIIYGKSFYKVFETCPEHLRPKSVKETLLFPNGSRIRVGGTDGHNYENLRGGSADMLILDEAGFMAHLDTGVIPALQPMLIENKGKAIYSSTPPPSLDHPYVEIYRAHRDKGHINHFTIFDNKHIDQDGLLKLYEETGSTPDRYTTRFRREYLAEFVQEDTVQIARDWQEEFVEEIEHDEFFQFYHKYVAIDPGVVDLTGVLYAYYDYQHARLVIEDEWTINGPELTTELLANAIKDKLAELEYGQKPYRLIADNNNLHLIQDLGKIYGLPFIGTSKTRLESKTNQDEGMVNKLNMWLRQGKIVVNPRCTQLLGCLRYGIWEEKNGKREFAKSKKYGHFDHLAALMYLVRNTDVHTNPVPGTYKFDPAEQYRAPTPVPTHNPDLWRLQQALQPRRRK